MLAALLGWLEREQRDIIRFLREENRALKAQLHGKRLRLSDRQRRRLAVIGHELGRATLRRVATIVTPDTILRWHRELDGATAALGQAGRARGNPSARAADGG